MEFTLGMVLGWAIPFALLLLLAFDHYRFAAFITLVAIVTAWYFNRVEVPDLNTLIWYCVAWLVVGVLMSLLKWYLYVRNYVEDFQEYFTRESQKRTDNEILTPSQVFVQRRNIADAWNTSNRGVSFLWIKNLSDEDHEKNSWDVRYNKADLAERTVVWIIFWPFYALLLAFQDVLVRLLKRLSLWLGKTYDSIAAYATRGLN